LSTTNDIAADTAFAAITFIAAAGAFILAGNRITLDGNITNNSSNNAIIQLQIILSGTRTFDTASGQITVSGVMSGASGALTKSGSNVLLLNVAVGTYAAGTTINEGTLYVAAGAVAGTGTITINANGAILLLWNTTVNNAIVNAVNGGILSLGGLVTIGGNITINAAISWVISNSTQTISGNISGSGAITMTQTGGGKVTLSGTNTFTGTLTISSGTVYAGSTAAFGTFARIVLANEATAILDTTGYNNTTGLISGGGATGGNIVLGAATLQVGSNEVTPQTYAGVISGTGNLWKAGTSDWTLTGANTYTGKTVIVQGTLRCNSIKNVGGGASALGAPTTTANGTIEVQGFDPILVYTGSGDTTDRVLYCNGGGPFHIDHSGSGTLTFTSDITYNVSTMVAVILEGTGTSAVFSGTIPNAAGNTVLVFKQGTGRWTLSGNNTFSAGLFHNGGYLTASTNNTALGAGGVTIGDGALRLSITDGLTLTNNFTISGTPTGTAGHGLIENTSSGTATLSGTFTINSSPTNGGHFAGASTGALTLSGAITSIVNVSTRIGIVILSNAGSSYTTLNVSGTVRLGIADAIPTGATVNIGVSTTGVLDLAGYNQTVVGVTKSSSAATIGNSSTATSSRLTTTGTYEYAGVIQDVLGGGNKLVLVTINGGVATLSDANTYTGATTVSAGTLIVTGSLAAGSTVAVASGATLKGTGTAAGTINVASGGITGPGLAGTAIGTLTTGAFNLPSGAIFSVDLDGTGPTNDKVISTATATLGGTLAIPSAINTTYGKAYTILQASAVSGIFAGLIDGSIIIAGGIPYQVNYTATTVVLTDVSSIFICISGVWKVVK
jgi:autotransporter-associated beta strand protein